MQFKEWINEIIKTGILCGNYTDKVNGALSKKRLMDVCLDANGASWLPELQAKGFGLPYETILTEFKGYINGRYVAEYKNEKGHGYASTLYCCHHEDDKIEINTTLTTLLGCRTKIFIKENDFVRLYVDKNCELVITCPQSSRCIVEYWKGAKIEVLGNHEKVELIEKTC